MVCFVLVCMALAAWQAREQQVGTEIAEFRRTLRDLRAKKRLTTIGGRHFMHPEFALGAADDLRDSDLREEGVPREHADLLPAITHFRDELAARGVDLIVVPVPNRILVYPEVVGWRQTRLGATRVELAQPFSQFIGDLRDAGVTVLDLLPAYQHGAVSEPEKWIQTSDSHWTGHGAVHAARELAELLTPYVADTPRLETRATWETDTRTISMGRSYGLELGEETVVARAVVHLDGSRLDTDVASPVLVMGDSYVGWYTSLDGDIARQVAHELHIPVARIAVHGGGASQVREELARQYVSDPAVLDRRVVVWLFDAAATLNRPWRLTRLDPWPPTRLEQLHKTEVDRALVVDGHEVGLHFDKRWVRPRLEGGHASLRDAFGYATVAGAWPGPASLIMEAVSGGDGNEVDVHLDGVRLGTLHLGREQGQRTRHRLDLPDGVGVGEHRLQFQVKRFERDYSLGLTTMTLARAGPWFRLDMEELPRGLGFIRAEGAQGGRERFVWTEDRVRLDLRLEQPPAKALVRLRARLHRSLKAAAVRVSIGGELVATLSLSRQWSEHAVALPDGLLTSGMNHVRLVVDPEAVPEDAPDRRLAWEMLEIDSL